MADEVQHKDNTTNDNASANHMSIESLLISPQPTKKCKTSHQTIPSNDSITPTPITSTPAADVPSKNASIPTPSPIQYTVDPQQYAILSKHVTI
jgi:hypothetical protein